MKKLETPCINDQKSRNLWRKIILKLVFTYRGTRGESNEAKNFWAISRLFFEIIAVLCFFRPIFTFNLMLLFNKPGRYQRLIAKKMQKTQRNILSTKVLGRPVEDYRDIYETMRGVTRKYVEFSEVRPTLGFDGECGCDLGEICSECWKTIEMSF